MQQINSPALMDFKVLSRYDDLFTDIFLDSMHLWFNTIKMNVDHRRPRVANGKILDIIQRHVLEKARPSDAVAEMLAMDYFKSYLGSKNIKQVQEFVQHMKRYLYMYMPNAGYEVGDTRRYGNTGRKVEACLIATRDWCVGDEMRLLTGMIACLDPKDDAELKKGNRDFSVMWSTRKNCSCLFLGPARFANHDCVSNCKFISLGQNSISFKVIREIKCGEEITVYYGKHYFGENNCECRCVTCENQGTGYFATLDTKESTPMTEEEAQGGTRRSTRKRKSALYEDHSQNRRVKRASLEVSPSPQPVSTIQSPLMADPSLLSEPVPSHHRHSIGSLEELIGEETDNDQDEGKKNTTKEEIKQEPTAMELNHPIIKQEEEVVPKDMGLSTTEAATITIVPEEDENIQDDSLVRPLCVQQEPKHSNVMSINFLCGNGQQEQDTPNYERRRSSNSPLDLLVDAVMDAEYLRVQEEQQKIKKLQQQQLQQNKNQHEITVVVNTDINRDATQRVQSHNAVANWDYSPPTQLESPTFQHLDDGSNESKADSAVSLSPRFNESATFKKEEDDDMEDGYRWQQREMDDGLFNNNQGDQAFDEMLDDVSDLSSISSAEMCGWSDEDDDEEDEDEDGTENESTPSTPKNTTSARKSLLNQELMCIACSRPLRRQDISDQVGADAVITNELATWTWSPSAVFMDWRPKRCPRCERHKIIYKQEWPNRKHKKANTGNKKKSKKMKKKKTKPVPASASSASAPSNNTTATLSSSSATTPMTVTPAPMAVKSEVNYTEPIYQMQDDPQDLNYIPTSPLSTISDNDDDGDDDLY